MQYGQQPVLRSNFFRAQKMKKKRKMSYHLETLHTQSYCGLMIISR